jgi:hypothetical protein
MTLVVAPETAFYRIHNSNSIHSVPPFLHNLDRIVKKEREGKYPGGRENHFLRKCFLGGLSFFWVKRSLRAGLYKEALRVALSKCHLISAAIVMRAKARIKGRQPIRVLELSLLSVHENSTLHTVKSQ